MINEGAGAAKPAAVPDSNVIISGFAFSGGNPGEILDLLRRGEIYTCISPFILEEVSQVWKRRFTWEESRIEEALLFLNTYCTVINPPQEASVSGVATDDNHILDCAAHGDVQYLVTGDRGIQGLREFQGVSILSPADFLRLLMPNQPEE